MKFFPYLPAAATLVLASCAPESALNPTRDVPPQPPIPTGPETSFVRDLRGSRIDFHDKHGENSYKLTKLNTYSATCLSRKKHVSQASGVYYYKQTGPRTGELTLDLQKTYQLKFTSPHRATARLQGGKAAYTFEFEWM